MTNRTLHLNSNQYARIYHGRHRDITITDEQYASLAGLPVEGVSGDSPSLNVTYAASDSEWVFTLDTTKLNPILGKLIGENCKGVTSLVLICGDSGPSFTVPVLEFTAEPNNIVALCAHRDLMTLTVYDRAYLWAMDMYMAFIQGSSENARDKDDCHHWVPMMTPEIARKVYLFYSGKVAESSTMDQLTLDDINSKYEDVLDYAGV